MVLEDDNHLGRRGVQGTFSRRLRCRKRSSKLGVACEGGDDRLQQPLRGVYDTPFKLQKQLFLSVSLQLPRESQCRTIVFGKAGTTWLVELPVLVVHC